MSTAKEDPQSRWPHYFTIGAGLIIAAMALTKESLGAVGVGKVVVALGLVGYGIWKVVEGRRGG